MQTYLVSHEWDVARSEEVKNIVSGIIDKERNSSLPEGFHLLGVMLSSGEPKAYCIWQAASKQELVSLLSSVNPPTTHSVDEYQILFGESRMTA